MTLKLNSGFAMPSMGFGTYGIKTTDPFITAFKIGYRHIDTASYYDNEELIGEAIERASKEGIVQREDIFITTKLWHDDYSDPEAALLLSLKKLQTSYVDLYLIHWPLTGLVENKVPMHVLWAKMESLVEKGLARSIGVSNFNL